MSNNYVILHPPSTVHYEFIVASTIIIPQLTGVNETNINQSKVNSLDQHEEPLKEAWSRLQQELQVPLSSVDPEHVVDYISREKTQLANCDIDLKDAKRRISAVKPSKKRRGQNAAQAPEDHDSDSDNFDFQPKDGEELSELEA